MIQVNVKGGTGAGRRVTREAASAPWLCDCHDDGHRVLRPPYWRNCPKCGARRPERRPGPCLACRATGVGGPGGEQCVSCGGSGTA